MIDLADARAAILGAVRPLPVQSIASLDAVGLALADDVVADAAVPPFANSAMDGYAVRAADTAGAPVRLRVVGELAAGHARTVAVGAGEAIRIMTGAPVPDGADAVVIVERTTRDGDDGVVIEAPAVAGQHVRAAGGDVQPGDVVLARGTELNAAALGVLASIGRVSVRAAPRARVGVLSTGDELVEGAAPLAPGQIRDANRPMLLALVRDAGCVPVDLGLVRDDEALLEATLRAATASCDAIVTSGGVSVGDYDVVKAVLARIADMQWWQVAIQPAKPLAFGTLDGRPVFGLPGNPVSSLVSFELFARPALRQMMGHPLRFRPEVAARAGHAFARRRDGKLHLDRARLAYTGGEYTVTSAGAQASNVLSAAAAANALALVPDGDGVEAGEVLQVLRLDTPCDR